MASTNSRSPDRRRLNRPCFPESNRLNKRAGNSKEGAHVREKAQNGAKAAEARAGFSEATELLGKDDLLVVWKLDWVGRSIADLVHLLKLFGGRGIESRSLTDGIDTTTG